jgi:Uma2 family endonuclease
MVTTILSEKKKRITVEEFLALPDDGIDRWLIRGELREAGEMTVRNWMHSTIMARLALAIGKWWEQQPAPRGTIVCGEAGVRISDDDVVGVDVAYVSAEVMARQSGETTLIDGVPTLAAEIQSPGDKLSEFEEKIDEYLRAGVPLVWAINPMRRTATVYRPDTLPRLVTEEDSLSGEEVMPGLSVSLRSLFE